MVILANEYFNRSIEISINLINVKKSTPINKSLINFILKDKEIKAIVYKIIFTRLINIYKTNIKNRLIL